MRIVFISGFNKFDHGGGHSRITFELFSRLKERAKQRKNGNQYIFIRPAFQTELSIEDEYINIPAQNSVLFPIPFLSKRNIRAIEEELNKFKPDVIHSQVFYGIPTVIQKWAMLNKVPFVLTAHNILSKTAYFGPVGSKLLAAISQKTVLTPLNNTFVNNCTGVIVLNEAINKEIIKMGYKGSIYQIPNGVSLETFPEHKIIEYEKKNKIILTFVGFICKRKNQAFLIAVFLKLPENYELRLIGSVLEETYFQQYVEPKIGDRIKWLGQVNHIAISQNLQETDIFISASKLEVQSLVILEALTAGLPIVALENETTEDLIDNSVGKLLPENATEMEFAEAIQSISNLSVDALQKIRNEGKHRAEQFKWSNVLNKTEAMYIDQLKRTKGMNAKNNYSLSKRLLFILAATIVVTVSSYTLLRVLKKNRNKVK